MQAKKKKRDVKTRKSLRSYQQEAFDKFKEKSSAYLAMEMRLGKTLTAIRLLEHWKVSKVLIFAPKTTLLSWEEELKEEGRSFINLASYPTKIREPIYSKGAADFFLLNYQSAAALLPKIKLPDAIVCDESTKIKSWKAQVTKAMLEVCDRVPYKICLSGLPVPNTWHDIYSQCAFLGDGYFMGTSNYYKWRNRNFTQDYSGYSWDLTGKQRAKIKEEYGKISFRLTRKQAGLGEQKIRSNVWTELSAKDRKFYDYVEKYWETPDESFVGKQSMVVGSYLYDWLGDKKVEAFESVLDEIPTSEQFVVWVAHNSDFPRVASILKGRSISFAELNGSVRFSSRRVITKDFRSGRLTAVIVQSALGQFGLRFDNASVAVYYSTSYNYEDRAQSEDRIVRVGKKEPLTIINIRVKDTVEDAIYENIQEKRTDARFLMARLECKKREMVKR